MSSTQWLPLTERLKPTFDSVHIVQVNLQSDELQIESLRRLLSPDELTRADRYKVETARRHFIVCRGALRNLLGSCLDRDPGSINFEYGAHGKPGLRTEEGSDSPPMTRIEFSVSHSADQALIAIALGRRLGVDLERMDRSVRFLELAKRFFSAREAAELNTLPATDQLAGFFRGWTCKEAYLKGTGLGLAFPLNKFSVSLNPHEPARLNDVVDQPAELNRWQLHALDHVTGFAAAILFEATGHEHVTLNRWIMPPAQRS